MWVSGYPRPESALLSDIELVSGIVDVDLFFAAAAASIKFSQALDNPAVLRASSQFGNPLLIVFAMRVAAVFVFTTSTIAWGARVSPRWFACLGEVAGLFLLLSATFSPLSVLVFPLWLLALCLLLLWWARTMPADAAVGERPEQLAPRPWP